MAVISKEQAKQSQKSDTVETSRGGKEKDKDLELVIDDILTAKGLYAGDAVQLDPEEDAWAYGAPPPMDNYEIQLFAAKEHVKLRTSERDASYKWYTIALEGKIINSGDFDGVVCFPQVSTSIPRGKSISTAAGLIAKLGYKLPERATQLEVAQLLVKVIKKEPVTRVLLDWNLYSSKDGVTIYKTMLDFPSNGEGGYEHEVTRTAKDHTSEDLRAQLRVTYWYGKKEELKTIPGKGKGVEKEKVLPKEGAGTVRLAPVSKPVEVPKAQESTNEVDTSNDTELILED